MKMSDFSTTWIRNYVNRFINALYYDKSIMNIEVDPECYDKYETKIGNLYVKRLYRHYINEFVNNHLEFEGQCDAQIKLVHDIFDILVEYLSFKYEMIVHTEDIEIQNNEIENICQRLKTLGIDISSETLIKKYRKSEYTYLSINKEILDGFYDYYCDRSKIYNFISYGYIREIDEMLIKCTAEVSIMEVEEYLNKTLKYLSDATYKRKIQVFKVYEFINSYLQYCYSISTNTLKLLIQLEADFNEDDSTIVKFTRFNYKWKGMKK